MIWTWSLWSFKFLQMLQVLDPLESGKICKHGKLQNLQLLASCSIGTISDARHLLRILRGTTFWGNPKGGNDRHSKGGEIEFLGR